MYPTTPPVTDYSRPRLRQIAVWIRDELDPVIARDGPEILRADDVLMLHEMFYALRHSQTISALDLRATGIHRAVMEVAGTATRWPGRLADDCDKIILVWQKKFGALENLRPFMYGRAGRLEGIASATEFSKGALIQRWQKLCPQKILSERSHSTGDLGFSAGSWWINPLFAHHAGIIDLDTTDGGICHDNYGAYAVFLKETGEIEALSEESITYRCSPDDKGRFRLTSAVSRGRIRIRILRSHSLDSIWGPKAGVRYEGLYRVSGWTIRPVKTGDFGGPEHKVGDLMYEIKFERDDPVPMTEVMRHPTTFELDDYTEYKRLRRMQHEGSQKPTVERVETPGPAKVAAHIPSLTAPFTQLHPLSQTRNNPGPSRSPTLRYPLATIAGRPSAYLKIRWEYQ
ncbi:hypothetical protein K504DRAFT_33427 [Pleomassaria siparia CBS 279.74]|uniref:YDG domain-containing protein n=1 Tax=Pleomassaria siparia CBS 279.74 TaxID=1314801 RepID=A0A6G1KSX5_9PLEO|nr:hypothetical protein K504DRAFT_33427 [Pleomassaria siparia CBS 279.74]